MKETKDKNKENGQKLYKIRLYKDFEFPSFSISPSNTLEDLYIKSLEELNDNFNRENYFSLEISQILPFTLEKPLPKDEDRRDFNFFVREIALYDLESRYGKLEYKTNPKVFDRRTKNDGMGVDPESPYKLKVEVENYFHERVQHYFNILKNIVV